MAIGSIINFPKEIKATSVTINDEDNIFESEEKTVENVLKEVFINVSDGKEEVATAITDMGIETSSNETFIDFANKIRQIIGNVEIQKTKLNVVAPFTYEITLNKPISVRDICSSVLVYIAGEQGVVNYICDFDNSDEENFINNPDVIYDGTMRLKNKINEYDMLKIEKENINIYESETINKNDWNTIDKIELKNENNLTSLIIEGTNKPVFIQANNDINLQGIEEFHSIEWNSVVDELGVTLILLSIDSGVTWKSYFNDSWVNVNIDDLSNIVQYGMDKNIVNNLTSNELNKLETEWAKIRFGYYLELKHINGLAINDSISIKVNMPGKEDISEGNIYSYKLSSEGDKIIYSFTQDGTYTINVFNPI